MALPKNFYNAVDAKKMGLDDIETIKNEIDSMITLPPATSADEGKTIVVDSQGSYVIGDVSGLPDVSIADEGKGLIVDSSGEWAVDDLPDPIIKITGTLPAGQTSVTITNDAITNSALYDIYVDKYGIVPINVVVSTGSITLTFSQAESSDLGIVVTMMGV